MVLGFGQQHDHTDEPRGRVPAVHMGRGGVGNVRSILFVP